MVIGPCCCRTQDRTLNNHEVSIGIGESLDVGNAFVTIEVGEAEKKLLVAETTEYSDLIESEEVEVEAEEEGINRLDQDINVDPEPPGQLPLTRSIGPNASQNATLQQDISAAEAQGADPTDIRVNQQQVNADDIRVGVNRPDLQYTLNGERVYVEYDTTTSSAQAHLSRILSNDPGATVILKVFNPNGTWYVFTP